SGELMEQHFWGATVSGAGVFFAIGLYLLSQRFQPIYPFYIGLLVLTNLSIGFTGHIGGSITHGKDYLTEYVPLIFQDEPAGNKTVEEMLVYDDMISPIFQAKCMSCHNQSRSKGGLTMSSLQSIAKGGDSGLALITPEDLEQSELFNRVTLPADHDDVMPPEGQSPMSEQEIELLKYWITSGASPEQKVTALQAQPEIASVTNELLPQLARYRRKQAIAELKLKEVTDELVTLGKKLNLAIEPDSLEPGLFSLRVKFPPAPFSNDQFRELAPYNDAFSRLSIVSSSINDDGLYHISQMTNVKKLFLQKTNIDGSGFIYLMQMPNLETLNLSFTKVDDKVALDLLKFPSLKEVYLLGTKCTPQVVEALRKNKPGLKILFEEGPYF
ncbi:MAG: c-type cytochrome domain-containing protein, partial [Imperialibacter sp.]